MYGSRRPTAPQTRQAAVLRVMSRPCAMQSIRPTQGAFGRDVRVNQIWFTQRVKKSHSWPIECVGATIGRPPTWRSNAFSGKMFHRQTGRSEQCSPLQEFFDKLSESNLIHFFGFTTPEWISSDSLWRSSCVFCTISQNWSNHKYTSFPCYIVIPYNPLEYTFRGRKKSPENLTDLVRPSGLFQYFLCSIRA